MGYLKVLIFFFNGVSSSVSILPPRIVVFAFWVFLFLDCVCLCYLSAFHFGFCIRLSLEDVYWGFIWGKGELLRDEL